MEEMPSPAIQSEAPAVIAVRRIENGSLQFRKLAGPRWVNNEPQELSALLGFYPPAPTSYHWVFGGSAKEPVDAVLQDPSDPSSQLRIDIQEGSEGPDSAIVTLRKEHLLNSATANASDDRLLMVLNATKDIWSLSGACSYVYEVNLAGEMRVLSLKGPFALIYGINAQELKVPTFSMFLKNIVPDDRPDPDGVRKILMSEGKWKGAYRVRGQDGTVRHMRHHAVYHEHSEGAYVQGLILDDSAVENEREVSSAFRLSVENSREGFAIMDSQGRFTYMNQEHARLFGYADASELLGQDWTNLYRPAEAEFIRAKISGAVSRDGFWRGHLLALKKDGETFQEDLTLSLLSNRGILCICRDRTEEIRINARLEESETMLRTLFDALPMGIIIRDEYGVRQFANGFMLRQDPTDPSRPSGVEWVDSDHDWKRLQGEADRQVLATTRSCEFVISPEVAKQKRSFRCIVFLIPASTHGARRVGSLIMDITRQKQLEQEANTLSERRREYLEMQREFISMVSHEFRTPLTAIHGAQFLLDKLIREATNLPGPVVEKAVKWLDLQSSGLSTLKKLVDQVLVLNRIEHMTGEASLVIESPAEVLKETVARFNDSMDTARVRLQTELSSSFTASMDPGLVKAAVENLVSNGLKYSPLDQPVTVRLYSDGAGWTVEVKDHGRGIPKGDQANLFRPFFRAGNVGTVPGTGLGLAIVQRSVAFHGGSVAFESAETKGTTFRLHFPNIARPPSDEPSLGRVHILRGD